MINYLLRIPKQRWELPSRPRRKVQVMMCSDDPDKFAEIEFLGDERDVSMVREALLNWAHGTRGSLLEEETTPRNLAVAMSSPAIRKYEPVQLQGSEMFEPIEISIINSLCQLAENISKLFISILPKLPSFDSVAIADFLEQIQLIIISGHILSKHNQLPSNTTSLLLTAIREKLEISDVDEVRLEAILQEAYSFLKMAELQIPQKPEQVSMVLQRLVDFLKSPEGNFTLLMEDLFLSWTSVGK